MNENIYKLIGQGEGNEVEFKKNENSVAQSVCAMANSNGGNVLVGIDDNGKIVGVGKKIKERIATALQALVPYPEVAISYSKVEGKEVIVIKIKKSKSLVHLGKKAFIRVGRSNRGLYIEEMLERAVELTDIKFDIQPSTLPTNVIDKKYLKWYLDTRKKTRGIPTRGTLKENMRKTKICVPRNGQLYPTYGGILFFSPDPGDYIPGARARIIVMDGHETESVRELSGPVWKIADDAYSQVVGMIETVEVRTGVKRKKVLIYPEGAIKEAIINALAHRNYIIDADIRIFVRDDALIVRSPGSFPPLVDIKNPDHYPRNPLLCQFLYDCGYIERYGFGIIRILEECHAHPYSDVRFDVTPSKVDVVFYKEKHGIDEIDRKIIALVGERAMSSSEIGEKVGLSKVSVLKRIKKLMGIGEVKRIGRGAATRYHGGQSNK